MREFIVNLIKFYQKMISPVFSYGFSNLSSGCRFYPSCSEYSILAIKKYGVIIGSLRSFSRILKCGPWARGGVDNP